MTSQWSGRNGRLLYPELEGYLASLSRPAAQVVVTNGSRAAPRAYTASYASRLVRKARRLAGLGEHVTLDACRHGGMTELGDAELAEQGVMALPGHKTPEAARLYVKPTAARGGEASNLGQGKSLPHKNGIDESGNAASPTAQVPDIVGTASWDRTRDPQIHNLVL